MTMVLSIKAQNKDGSAVELLLYFGHLTYLNQKAMPTFYYMQTTMMLIMTI